jgi:hypothetical protein
MLNSTRHDANSAYLPVDLRVRLMSDEEILVAWCGCTARPEDDPEFQAVYEELTKRQLLPELH